MKSAPIEYAAALGPPASRAPQERSPVSETSDCETRSRQRRRVTPRIEQTTQVAQLTSLPSRSQSEESWLRMGMTEEEANASFNPLYTARRFASELPASIAEFALQAGAAALSSLETSTRANHDSVWTAHWLPFCRAVGAAPVLLQREPTPGLRQANTWLLLTFCCWVVRRMEEGRGRGAEIESAFGNYVSRIVGRHQREWCRRPDFDQSVLSRVRDSLKKARLARSGPRQRHRRLAIVTYHFARFYETPGIDWTSDGWSVFDAIQSTASEGGFRLGELLKKQRPFNGRRDYTRFDLVWRRKDTSATIPIETVVRPGGVCEGDYCELPGKPSKTDTMLEKYADASFPFVYHLDGVINAARTLLQLERRFPLLDPDLRAQTPLFAEPGTTRWYSKSRFYRQVKRLVERAFGTEMAKRMGTHSYRIGGACLLKMRGKTDAEIMAWGRWSSDAYRRYIRLVIEQMCMTVDPHREAEILRVPHEQVDLIARHLPPLNQSELFESGSARRGDWTMLDLVSQAARGGLARAILVGR